MRAIFYMSCVVFMVVVFGDIIYPVDFSHQLLPVVPDNVLCPVGHLHSYPEARNQYKIAYSRLSGFGEFKIKGKLCHKFILTTICDEDILWSKSITYTIQNARIDSSECFIAIRKAGEVLETIVEHPPPSCSWAQTVSVSKEFIQVKDHPVSYDPYSGNLIDGIFPDGKTEETHHETIYDSGYWAASEDIDSDKFTQMEHGYGVLYFPDNWDPRDLIIPEARFWSERFRERDFVGACRLKFRRTDGIRFRNGEWFAFNFIEEAHKSYFIWWSRLDVCRGEDLKLKIADPYESEHHTVESLAALMFYDRCQSSVSKLRNNMALTPLDVSYLAQTYPGVGPAYIISESGLKTFMTQYELIKKSVVYERGVIGTTSANKEVRFTNWTERSNMTHGPNGLVLKGNKLIFPAFAEMRSQIETELTQEISLEELHRSEMINGTHRILTSFDIIHRNPDQMDVVHVVETGIKSAKKWAGAVGTKIITYIIGCISILCITYLVGILIQRYYRSRSPRSDSPNLIPMSSFHTERNSPNPNIWFH
ncbi:glycoprotein [Shayang Fly Virus 2]|uniref:Glycoprotein n=1 Tax=Shayang Fly Virus 2 TaxID=1608066 RepID=A0A0B5KK40_9RHAB|nr:glycoprotein [Shayang Fly Virus 2]AJG39125.1 glycoprotein [Shayang Fly Virus 2]